MSLTSEIASEELLLDPAGITNEFVAAEIDKLVSVRDKPRKFFATKPDDVIRTRRHTIAWIRTYVITECEELSETFVSPEKSYQVMVVRGAEETVKFMFRLKTRDLDGYTEYGISVKRVGDHFSCKE